MNEKEQTRTLYFSASAENAWAAYWQPMQGVLTPRLARMLHDAFMTGHANCSELAVAREEDVILERRMVLRYLRKDQPKCCHDFAGTLGPFATPKTICIRCALANEIEARLQLLAEQNEEEIPDANL